MRYKNLVDREAELSALIGLVKQGVHAVYLYGPRGVGISTLLRRFAASMKGFRNYLVVYVDAIEGDRVDSALIASETAEPILRELASSSEMPPGSALLYALPIVLVRLGLPSVMGRHVLVIVDHLDRGIGPGKTLDYLDSLMGTARKLIFWRALSVTIIGAGTQLGLKALLSSPNKGIEILRVNGLPLSAYKVLVSRLGIEVDPETLWRLTGGNPGETIILATRYKGDIDFWKRALAARLRRVIRLVREKGLLGELSKAVQGLDNAFKELLELLQAHDIVLRADTPILGGGYSKEKWVWSLPVYRDLIAEIISDQEG